MSSGNTVMMFGLGDLGGWVLEFLARTEGVSTIIAVDSREEQGEKLTTTAIGAAQQGYYKTMKFYKCDARDIDVTAELIKTINPSVIYSNITMAGWPQLEFLTHEEEEKASRASLAKLPLQIVLVSKLMQAVKESSTTAPVLNHALPDVVNPVLWRNGLGPLVGVGNLDNVVAEINWKISQAYDVPIPEIRVFLIGAHTICSLGTRTGVPFSLKILIRDKDITSEVDAHSLISDRSVKWSDKYWRSQKGYPYVAAAAVKNIMAVLNDSNLFTHAPSPVGLPGGYPVRLSAKNAEVVLPEGISLDEAIRINLEALKHEGIAEIKEDGTLVSTDEAYQINRDILGIDLREIRFRDMDDISKELLSVYKKLADKHKASITGY